MNKEFEREAEKRYPYKHKESDAMHNMKFITDYRRQAFIDGYTLAQQGERERALGFAVWLEKNYLLINEDTYVLGTDIPNRATYYSIEQVYTIYTQQLTQEKEK